jgi:hypothetical protein
VLLLLLSLPGSCLCTEAAGTWLLRQRRQLLLLLLLLVLTVSRKW